MYLVYPYNLLLAMSFHGSRCVIGKVSYPYPNLNNRMKKQRVQFRINGNGCYILIQSSFTYPNPKQLVKRI